MEYYLKIKKYIFFKIHIFILIFTINVIPVYCQGDLLGGDITKSSYNSIEIINRAMEYYLSYLLKTKLEDVSFNYYKKNNFIHLYDSLCSIYTPFKYIHYEITDAPCILFTFLVDTCTVYYLELFITPNLYKNKDLSNERRLFKLLPKMKEYGILANKDNVICAQYKEAMEYDNSQPDDVKKYITPNPILEEFKILSEKLKQKNKK